MSVGNNVASTSRKARGLSIVAASALVLGLMALAADSSRAQDKGKAPPADPGYTVLDKGPIHEAFAQPNQRQPEAGPIVGKEPPPNVNEQPPDQKPQGENVQWIPGYWSWDADKNDYIWVSGFWRVPPPDRHWVPGYWNKTEGGWQWVPGFWMADEQQNLQYVPQPPASLDNGANIPAPDENSIYIPGNWLYRDDGYAWQPGYWSTGYDDWVWTPACYRWTPAGYTYLSGYWDYPVVNRGLLFAPVAFNAPLWADPGWYYQPSYCIDVGYPGFLTSLFFRPAWCSYYYGNYFAPYYAGLGFYPWCTFGGRFFDPLFGFAAFYHRFDPGYFPGLRGDFFAQRNTFINNTTVNSFNHTTVNNFNAGRIGGPGALAGANTGRPGFVKPLNQFHSSAAALTRVPATQQTSQRLAAQNIRTAALQRSSLERSGSRIGQSVPLPSALRSAGSAAVAQRSSTALQRASALSTGYGRSASFGSGYANPGFAGRNHGGPSYGYQAGNSGVRQTPFYSGSPGTASHNLSGGPYTGRSFYSSPGGSGSAWSAPNSQPHWSANSSGRSLPHQSMPRSVPSFSRSASFSGGGYHSSGSGIAHGGGGYHGGGGGGGYHGGGGGGYHGGGGGYHGGSGSHGGSGGSHGGGHGGGDHGHR